MSAEILANVAASQGRRVFGVGVLAGLGLLLVRMGIAGGGGSWLDGLVIVMGVAALAASWLMYRATAHRVELRDEGLFNSDGTCLAAMEDIVSVDRGIFAFKPSNGFLVRTRRSLGRMWKPGLYWRLGNRIGVGGITRAAEAKLMADILTVKLAERAADAEAAKGGQDD